jgi:hypothetical protein
MAMEVTSMKRTRLNDTQLEKIVSFNKVAPASIALTASAGEAGTAKGSVVAADLFVVQGTSGTSQAVSASVMKTFFFGGGSGLDLEDGNITNGGDIDADSISISDAAVGLTIDGSGANDGLFKITMKDNVSDALNINQGGASYIKFGTSNGSELITFGKNSSFGGTTISSLGTVSSATSIASSLFTGPIDGIVGGNTPAAGTFTTITANTSVIPDASGGADLGSTSAEWGDIYIGDDKKIQFGAGQDATIEYDEDGTDELRFAGAAVTFEQAVTFDGAVTLGNATGDDIVVTGRIAADIDPKTDATYDLGASDQQWKDIYVHGIGYIDQLGTDGDPVSVYVNAGEIDGAVIGGESAAAATFTTMTATTSVLGTLGGNVDHGNYNSTNVDIDSGAIDGTTIGAASQSSVKATTLSGSSTLSVVGVSQFGPGALASISAAGVVSGSGTSTLHQLDADRIAVEVLDVNTINSNTITQNTLEISDYLIVAGLSGSSSNLNNGGFKIGGGAEATGLGSVVWNDSDLGLRVLSGSTAVLKINSSGLQVSSGVVSGSGVATFHRLDADRATVDALTITSMADNWTNAGRTVADAGILTTVDINGGAIDGAIIGANESAAGTFVALQGVTITATSKVVPVSAGGATLGSATQEWGHIFIADDKSIQFGSDQNATIEYDEDGTDELRFAGAAVTFEQAVTFDGDMSLGNATGDTITVLGNSTFSGTTIASLGTVSAATAITSTLFTGPIDGTIGATTPAAAKFTTLSGSSTLDVAGVASFGAGNTLTISAAGLLSGSATATLVNATLDRATVGALSLTSVASNWTNAGRTVADAGILTTVDINGGSVDGATIGAASQSSVKGTTLSGSSTLSVVGVSSFGPAALTTISAAGVVSGSGTSTLHQLTADRVNIKAPTFTAGTVALAALDIDGGTDIGEALVAADLIVVDNGAGGTNRKSTLQRVGTLLGSGDGIQVTSGVLSVSPVEMQFYSGSVGNNSGSLGGMTSNLLTASLNTGSKGEILGGAEGSMLVFLNGMLQTLSGSGGIALERSIYDFRVNSISAPGFIYLNDALDEDDVLVVKYIKK